MLAESENFLKIFLRAVLFRRFAPSFCSVVLRAALVQICRFTVPFCPLFLARRFAPLFARFFLRVALPRRFAPLFARRGLKTEKGRGKRGRH